MSEHPERPCPNCGKPLTWEHTYDYATRVCATFPLPRPKRPEASA